MKKKNHSDNRYVFRKLVLGCLILLIGGLVLIKLTYWFFEERPQYIEVDFSPISDENWDYVEYATRNDNDGRYWLVRYMDICYDDCGTWLEVYQISIVG